jgi:hypothetical protein
MEYRIQLLPLRHSISLRNAGEGEGESAMADGSKAESIMRKALSTKRFT